MNNIALVYMFIFGPFFYSILESTSLNTVYLLLVYYMNFLLVIFTSSFYTLLFITIINALIFYFKLGIIPMSVTCFLWLLIFIASYKLRPYKNTTSFDDTKADICAGYNAFRIEVFKMIKSNEK